MGEWVRDHVTYIDDEVRITPIYKCGGCGREWDGHAQCFPCDPVEDEEGDEEVEVKEEEEVEVKEEEEEEEAEPPLLKRIKVLREEDEVTDPVDEVFHA